MYVSSSMVQTSNGMGECNIDATFMDCQILSHARKSRVNLSSHFHTIVGDCRLSSNAFLVYSYLDNVWIKEGPSELEALPAQNLNNVPISS